MHDLVIRNGTVIDGLGGRPVLADVAVDQGCITAVGAVTDPGREELDATGLAVTPGFVDVHTHYDGQVTWDPLLTPSIWHGVTTVVMGNCGVGFAPAAPDRHDWLIGLMEGVEGIPGASLREAIHWDWQSVGEYLDALGSAEMGPVASPDDLWKFIRDIPDFPRPGIVFKDITPLLGDADAFRTATALLAAPFCPPFDERPITKVVGIEARGFILAAPIALALGAGFVPVRKPGKLPWDTHAHGYELEYGQDTLEVHRDALTPDDRVLIVDDVLATGGTATAACRLVSEFFIATVVGVTFLLELTALGGRARLEPLGHRIESVLID